MLFGDALFQFGRHKRVELTDYDRFQLAVWIWQSLASLGHKSVVRWIHLLEEKESEMTLVLISCVL